MTLSLELAEWALKLKWNDLPSEVQNRVKEHALDGIGNAIGAASTDIADAAAKTVGIYGESNEASMWGTTNRTSVPAAVFFNSILIHALDFDDTHAGGLVHATAPTLPVAIALGESLKASGEEVITAYAAGLEVICRLGASTPHGFHARGLHATQVCGTIASAIVAAKLMRLSISQTVNAMGIAGSFSGGLLEFLNTGSSTKQIHPGIASQAGVIAAHLAANGATGPETVIEGEYGILKSLSDRDANLSQIVKGLGEVWECSQITIKPYPACQLSHVTLDATRNAWTSASASGVKISEIKKISAIVHPDSAKIVCIPRSEKNTPKTAYDAKFSLPWSVAALIIDGELVVKSFDQTSIKRGSVIELAEKFEFEEGKEVIAAAAAPGSVEITTTDGRSFSGIASTSAGGPSNRLSSDALVKKFLLQCSDQKSGMLLADELLRIDKVLQISSISAMIAMSGK
jgi:2-methylcitrate dehydratase PrpD